MMQFLEDYERIFDNYVNNEMGSIIFIQRFIKIIFETMKI